MPTNPYVRKPMPPRQEQIFTLSAFGGGLNNVETDTVFADNQASDTMNMRFLSAELMEKRYGTTYVDESVCGYTDEEDVFHAEPIVWLDEFKSNGMPNVFLKATASGLFVGSEKIANLGGGRVMGVNYLNNYYLVDGFSILRYDGFNARYIVEDPKSEVASDVSSGTALVLNSWDERIAVGSLIQIESAEMEAFKVTAIDSVTKTLTVSPAITKTHKAGTLVRLYIPNPKNDLSGLLAAATTAGATTFTLDNVDFRILPGCSVTTMDTGTETRTVTGVNFATKTITLASGFTNAHAKDVMMKFTLDGFTDKFRGKDQEDTILKQVWYEPCEYELDSDYLGENYIPKNPSVIVIHRDRLFFSGDGNHPHEVYMTDISNTLYCPVFSGLQVPPTGDEIVDMVVFDDALIVARHNDIYTIYGGSPDPTSSDVFRMKKMDTHIGMMSGKCSALLNNFLFYLGYDGKMYRLNTPTTFTEYLVTKPLTRDVDLTLSPLNLTVFDMLNCSAVAYNNSFFLHMGDKTIVYSFDNQAFTYYTGWKASCLYTDGVDLYLGRSDGRLSMYDKAVTDDCGEPIEWRWYSKRFDFNTAVNYKYFKQALVTSHAYDDTPSYFSLSVEVDNHITREARRIPSNQSLFGVATYGQPFNNQSVVKSNWMMLDYRGRNIKLKLTNTALGEPFRLYDVNVIWTARDVR